MDRPPLPGPPPSGRQGPLAVVVAVAEDRPGVSQIIEVLEREGQATAVVVAVDDAWVRRSPTPPDAVVLAGDPDHPRTAERLAGLRHRLPGIPTVIVARTPSSATVAVALDLGANGVVLEGDLERTLWVAVSAAYAGHVSVPATFRRTLVRPSFSYRERQTVGLAVAGHTNAQIAGALFLSESTVKSHLASAFRKLGVHSRKEAASVILDPRTGLAQSVMDAARERLPGPEGQPGPTGQFAA